MGIKLTPAQWRVGFVMLVYGILYLNARDLLPWWFSIFSIPIYMAIQPITMDMIKDHQKAHDDGLIFYLFKWTLIVLGALVALVFVYGFWVNFNFFDTVKALLQNSFIIVPLMLSVLVSWIRKEKAMRLEKERQYQLERAEKRKKKKKK